MGSKSSFFLCLFCMAQICFAQVDSTIEALQQVPLKYIKQVDSKIDKYTNSITNKTEKTLTKLSRWENKIKALLEKASPETAQRLFANNQLTFTTALEKYKQGEAIVAVQKAKYDAYSNKLSSDINYLNAQKEKLDEKLLTPLKNAKQKVDELEKEEKDNAVMQQFIKERKKQLISESLKYIGKSKYLQKINKESYYYAESLRNYKEVFADERKVEELVTKLLSQIPAFKTFSQQNSSLASLFAPSGNFPALSSGTTVPIVNGLPSRGALQQFLQNNMPSPAGVVNPIQQIQKQLEVPASPLNQLKNKLTNIAGKKDNEGLPDFTPNSQRSKSFFKRLEYSIDVQFAKNSNLLPATSDIAFKMGYKIDDKRSAGMGLNYKAGFGNGWQHIQFTNQGLGFKTYVKWKLKKNIDIQGGSEWNYMLQFNKIEQLKNNAAWQQSALLGLSKSYAVNKKVKGNVQVLYDFLYSKHIPNSQPLVFRFGYAF